ncbi:hypothetical protein [Pedobacter heparinus]|uniref:hypothetical protein n=1 Tax=Pedobacter heparinus TaxID=984 RepID=UPI00292DE98B|nr:hypothetical protein [Pedobacter heparinus]
MTTTLKKNMMIIALALATIGAFATKLAYTPAATAEVYTWHRTFGNPQPNEQSYFIGTEDQAASYYGCDGSFDECAVGIPADPLGGPVAVLYQN